MTEQYLQMRLNSPVMTLGRSPLREAKKMAIASLSRIFSMRGVVMKMKRHPLTDCPRTASKSARGTNAASSMHTKV